MGELLKEITDLEEKFDQVGTKNQKDNLESRAEMIKQGAIFFSGGDV